METAGIKKNRDFTQGALLPRIILFALPLMATGILQMLFNTADTIVVGRWGGETKIECENALAAVGSCGSLNALIINFFMGLAVGVGVCVAHDVGAKDYNGVQKTVHTAVITSAICGVLLCLAGMFLSRPLLTLMGTDEQVLDQAVSYMRAFFLGTPASMVYNYCAAALRSKGDTTRPLIFLSIAGVVNVGLNLVMVLVFHLGAIGVGLATAAANWISASLILWYMTNREDLCRIEWKKLRIYPEKLKKMFYIGFPASIQGMAFSFSNVVIQSSVNSLGKAVVAANTAAGNVSDYLYVAQNSVYNAAITFVGQNVGAKKYERIKSCVLNCVVVVTAIGLIGGILELVFGEFLLGLYSPGNEEVIRIGMTRLRYLALTYFLCGVMEVGSGTLRGLGKSVVSMAISLTGTCLFRVVWVATAFAHFQTIEVLYLSYPISWALSAIANYTLVFVLVRRLKRKSAKDLMELPIEEKKEASV